MLYRVVNEVFGESDLYLFTYYKRIISFLAPVSLLGLGVTLVRKVSVRAEESASYIVVSLLMTLIIPSFLLVLYFISPNVFVKLFFAGEDYKFMTIPIIINLIGLSFFSISISFLRGISQFIYASTLNLIFVVLVPFILLLFNLSLVNYLIFNGVFLVFVSIILNLRLNRNKIKFNFSYIFFLKEGLQRLVGDISYYFLLLAPSYFLFLFTKNIAVTSAISFCQVIMNSTTILIKPISFVKLTSSTIMSKDKNIITLKKDFFKVIIYVFLIFILISVIFYLSIELIINLLYSDSILIFLDEIKQFLIVIPFFGVYLSGRSYIDGITDKAIMSIINTVGLFIFLVVMFFLMNFLSSFSAISLGFTLSFVIMDLIMILFIKKYKL